MKKNKQKGFGATLELSPFPFDLYVAFGISYDEINKYIQKTIPEFNAHEEFKDINSRHHGRTLQFSDGQLLLYLPFVPDVNDPSDIALLEHELWHVTHMLLDRVNTPLVEATWEVYAYVLQYVTVEVLHMIKEYKNGN